MVVLMTKRPKLLAGPDQFHLQQFIAQTWGNIDVVKEASHSLPGTERQDGCIA